MNFFTADKIHDGHRWLENGAVLAFSDNGLVEVISNKEEIDPAKIQKLDGIACPGFVNAHCHLELSHMAGKIQEGTGLVDFLSAVVHQRSEGPDAIQEAIFKAGSAMQASGIVALGDIANSADTMIWRGNAQMHVHTFVETMGFIPETASNRFNYSKNILEKFKAQLPNSEYKRTQSIVPHAPYSVSKALFQLINDQKENWPIAIHNQECAAENDYYRNKTGDIQRLFLSLGITDESFIPSGKNSLQTFLPWLSKSLATILVHCTFTSKEDVDFIQNHKYPVHFCLCPNANLYIEKTLPDLALLRDSGVNICLGTDSLASNHQLSIYEEMQTILCHYPNISLEELISWATINGARALGFQHVVGSFKKGKRPGLVQIHNNRSNRIL